MPESTEWNLESVVSIPFAENTYIVWQLGQSDCLVIDPGLQPELILQVLDEHQLIPAALLITHGHADHIGGNAALKARWPDCPLVIGRGDEAKLSDAELNLSAGFGFPITSPPADVLLDEGDVYNAAGFELLAREIPGHSSGHIVFIWPAGNPKVVFGGDVLFAGGVGRTDLPGGSFAQLRDGIHQKLFELPDETIVYPGHGSPTTIGREKRTNPFVGLR